MYEKDFQAMCNAAKTKLGLLKQKPLAYFISSCLAGMYIGLGGIFMGIVGGTMTAGGSPAAKLAGGLVFALGLTLVIFAGAELFTGNNMVLAGAAMQKEVRWMQVGKLWVICYLGNFAGSIITGALFAGTGLAAGGVGDYFANIVQTKVTGTPMNLFTKGILCNICVCLAVWTCTRLKEEAAKCFVILLAVAAFVACGYEHSVANMTFFTIGLLIPHEAVVNLGSMGYNLLIVTIGNIIGGALFVALPYYFISKNRQEK